LKREKHRQASLQIQGLRFKAACPPTAKERRTIMAVCPTCGASITEGAAFCGNCGAVASKGAAPSAPPPPPQASAGSSTTGYGIPPNLIARVTNILTKPKEEWPVIAGESTSVAALYTNYIMLLAAIPVVASFISMSLIGAVRLVTGAHVGIIGSLLAAIVQYALSLAGVYLSAFVIEKLAPTFQSEGNRLQALKLVAYASTAAWVAGVCNILPIIGSLAVLAGAIYSIYLLYLGLPVMMKTPPDKVIVYLIVSIVVIIAIYAVIGLVVGAFTAAAFIGSRAVSGGY
jgi:hypothetical protein